MKYNMYQSFVSMVSGSLCCQSKYEAGVNFWTIEWIQKVKFYKMWLNYVSGKRKVSSARTEIQISTNHPTFNLFILSKPYKWFKRYKTYTYIQTVWMNRAGSICLWIEYENTKVFFWIHDCYSTKDYITLYKLV